MEPKKEDYPYKTYLNILHGPLEVIDVQKLVDACTDKWWNQTLCKVNDSVVRLGVIEGEYHWHSHKDLDEFFYVVAGPLIDRSRGSHCRSRPAPGIRRGQGRAASHTRAGMHRDPDGRTRGYYSDWRLDDPRVNQRNR
jgi:hypothetical protein